ncbi:hypothetical protein CFOL_v3_18219 [Cephalotus follicularis]|uniref:Zf-RVT domain-containing protein n=1 Tax=Cephalotus follicularis TaxID=3775 RepID=A0A1Q3C3E0_CEPFO|nr:hypothetical protein CFOL_v3_18219 [Cephalotus follicularis]
MKKIQQRFSGWKAKNLVGRTTLVQVVTYTISVYNRQTQAIPLEVCWKLLHDQPLLWVKVISTKYKKNVPLLEASNKPTQSHVWRNILKGLSCLRKGLVWKVGDGSNINVWSNNWMGLGPLVSLAVDTISDEVRNTKVVDLVDLNRN